MIRLIFFQLMFLVHLHAEVEEAESASRDLLPSRNEDTKKEVYSAPPNNTPLTRVFIFGKPVYIRQPFVVPQRNVTYGLRSSKFGPTHENLSSMLANPRLFDDRRIRNSQYSTDPAYGQGADPYSVKPKPQYPLPQCYTEKSGYMCCNKQLEKVMNDAIEEEAKNNWKSCNLQRMANVIQDKCQQEFGTDFETVGGVGDYASKIHFYSDYVCKMERHDRIFLSYGTPNRHNSAYPTPYRL